MYFVVVLLSVQIGSLVTCIASGQYGFFFFDVAIELLSLLMLVFPVVAVILAVRCRLGRYGILYVACSCMLSVAQYFALLPTFS